jgi:hypothetical protein
MPKGLLERARRKLGERIEFAPDAARLSRPGPPAKQFLADALAALAGAVALGPTGGGGSPAYRLRVGAPESCTNG